MWRPAFRTNSRWWLWVPACAGTTILGIAFVRNEAHRIHFSNSSVLSRHSFAISPRNSREFCRKRPALQSEGAGNAGRPMRPIAARAMIVVERTRVSQITPESPGIPRAMVYGLYRALPGERLFCHRRPRKLPSANLTPASGCQDHTPSPSASAPVVKGASASTASRRPRP
jgi:hypothetical protein